MRGRSKSIKITKYPAGTVFNVTIKHYPDFSIYKGTMEIANPRERALKFDLTSVDNESLELHVEMNEVSQKIKEGRAIGGTHLLGILRFIELVQEPE